MPEIATGFLPWVRFVRAEAQRIGQPISARRARALAPVVALMDGMERDGTLNDPPPPHGDPTGEEAVRRALAATAA